MTSLFPLDAFHGFGSTSLHPPGYQPNLAITRASKGHLLRQGVRDQAPRLPGVYGMLDRSGRLIYVGKAKSLRARLMSYFRVQSRDPKAGRIIQQSAAIVWESAPHEFVALVRELQLIRDFRPRFNVIGIPDRRRYSYICIGRPPAPYVYVTREGTGKELQVFGPVIGAVRVREAIRRLNDCFRLRDCSQRQSMHFADQQDLFSVERSPGCLRYEIATCLGPCVAACTRRSYGQQVRQVQTFLEGQDLSLLDQLEKEMYEAASREEFERAMSIRDKWQSLRWLVERLGFLREARNKHTYVYPLSDHEGRLIWYLIARGRVEQSVYAPATTLEKTRVLRQMDAIFKKSHASDLLVKGQADSVLLVSSWFRRFPHERDKILSPQDARNQCLETAESTSMAAKAVR